MRENGILDEILIEEYQRTLRRIRANRKELNLLPKGSLSKKSIKGYEAYYIHYREGDKVKCKYVPKGEVENLSKMIEKRRRYEAGLRENRIALKQLERALGKGLMNEYFKANGISQISETTK